MGRFVSKIVCRGKNKGESYLRPIQIMDRKRAVMNERAGNLEVKISIAHLGIL